MGRDGSHVYRRAADRGGGRRDVAIAFALRLFDVTVGWVEQVVQAVASERTTAEEVMSRSASDLYLKLSFQNCSCVKDCHYLVAMEKS